MMFPLFIVEGLKPESKVDSSNLTAFCEISRFASLELLDILISTKNFCKDIVFIVGHFAIFSFSLTHSLHPQF